MFAKPQTEHHWLNQLIGDWTVKHDCKMPDGSTSNTTGSMTCRSLRGMWLVCESQGESTEGDVWSSIMTVGFDPAKGKYVGTFFGSMMANIWLYEGILDSTGKCLPLETEGPAFVGNGTCKYRDTIEIMDADTWQFTSKFQSETGDWNQFMRGEHKRVIAV